MIEEAETIHDEAAIAAQEELLAAQEQQLAAAAGSDATATEGEEGMEVGHIEKCLLRLSN